jgi:hypothetical protein
MNKFLTEESPAKVMSLLGVALSSMFFLFAVTVSSPGFGVQQQNPFPDPFAPAKVMAVLDNTSNSYSNFLNAYLFEPAGQQVAFLQDNASFIADNAGPQISQMLGLNRVAQAYSPGVVAGASTQVVYSDYYPASGGSLGVFSFLFR